MAASPGRGKAKRKTSGKDRRAAIERTNRALGIIDTEKGTET